jgi:hypothetical protein
MITTMSTKKVPSQISYGLMPLIRNPVSMKWSKLQDTPMAAGGNTKLPPNPTHTSLTYMRVSTEPTVTTASGRKNAITTVAALTGTGLMDTAAGKSLRNALRMECTTTHTWTALASATRSTRTPSMLLSMLAEQMKKSSPIGTFHDLY